MANYRMQDESVTTSAEGAAKYAGKSASPRGEELRQEHPEAGMRDLPPDREGRRQGVASARMASAVNPLDPIDENMPTILPP